MTWHLPSDEAELTERLASGHGPQGSPHAGPGVAITGAPDASDVDPAIRRRAEETALEVISTAALSFRKVVSYEPRDQVVTVGAGLRLAALDEALAAEGQWIPAAAIAPGRTAGGLVAGAPAGPYDATYGPVRRQLLACRAVTHRGEALRWGRPVVKDVAGYDMKGLWCGSRGRLGVLAQVTFRTWPRPAIRRRYRIRASAAETEARLGMEMGRLTGREWFRPDALIWSWTAAAGAALRAELLGSTTSVEEREEALLRWAGGRGAQVTAERSELAAEPPGLAAETPETSPAPGGDATEFPELPRRDEARGRPWTETVLALRATPTHLPELLAALQRAATAELETAAEDAPGGRIRDLRLAAHPLAGTVRLVYRRGRASEERAAALRPLLATGEFTLAVERGGPEEHRAAESRRSPDVRALEQAVGRALGARPREWMADYL